MEKTLATNSKFWGKKNLEIYPLQGHLVALQTGGPVANILFVQALQMW